MIHLSNMWLFVIELLSYNLLRHDNFLLFNFVAKLNLNNKEYEIEAKTDVTIIFMEMHFILNPKNTSSQIYSQFLINLLELLNKKYTEASQRLDILTNKTIRNKLLEYFKNSYQETNARVLYLKSSFTALADYLAVDRSAMTRELKNLKDEGLIEIKNKKIKLLYFPLD